MRASFDKHVASWRTFQERIQSGGDEMVRIFFGLCLWLFGCLLVIDASESGAGEGVEPRALFEARCSKCHSLDRTNRSESPKGWQALVNRMSGKPGSGISEQDAEIILQYLVERRT